MGGKESEISFGESELNTDRALHPRQILESAQHLERGIVRDTFSPWGYRGFLVEVCVKRLS